MSVAGGLHACNRLTSYCLALVPSLGGGGGGAETVLGEEGVCWWSIAGNITPGIPRSRLRYTGITIKTTDRFYTASLPDYEV